jgi:hypothetical protein
MLDVLIHECSIHATLWHTNLPTTMTNLRINLLQRLLVSSQAFARTLLATPSSSLNCLTFPIWSGWFYSTLLVVKALIMRQTGSTDSQRLNNVPDTIGDLLPHEYRGSTTQNISKMTSSLEHASLSDSIAESEEVELVSLFQSFIQKMRALDAVAGYEQDAASAKPFLMKVAKLQEGLLAGIKKMMPPSRSHSSLDRQSSSDTSRSYELVAMSTDHQDQQFDPRPMEHEQSLNFALYDNATTMGYQSGQQLPVDDWLWDMVMTDANMFTL